MKGGTLPTRIDSFRGEWGFLSCFTAAEVKLCIDHLGVPWGGLTGDAVSIEEYSSVEHAYHASKFLDPDVRKRFQDPMLKPGDAKQLAKELKWRGLQRPDWHEVNIEIMRGLLTQKFTYSILRRKLLSTFTAVLIEGNTWHDNFWGDCVCPKCAKIEGKNNLGKLLMEIRNAAIA